MVYPRRKDRLVGVRVYFDGSGKNDTNVLTVGGFVAMDDVCSAIEQDWNAALVDEGFCDTDGNPGTFRLADFGTPYCKYGTGKWDTKKKRVPFLKRLASIVNREGNHIVSFSIENSQYREFLAHSPHPQIYGPEHSSGCAIMAFVFVEVQILDYSPFGKEEAVYIFEKGDRQHELDHAFMEYDSLHPEFATRGLRLLFESKKLPLLQAADLTCGKIHEVLERTHNALGFLDSGASLTPVTRFERYYSYDGTSEAIMKDGAAHNCYVANKSHFIEADRRIIQVIRNNPAVLERRLKRNLVIPK